MKNPMEFFEHDRLLHIDMIDALRDKTTKVIYSEEDGVLFFRGGGAVYFLMKPLLQNAFSPF